jgi:precorrin-6B methylase 2
MPFLNKLIRNIPPRTLGHALACLKILEFDYGHFFSTIQHSSVDKNNNPIPWYTYPTIEYLKQLDFSQKNVFEYGSGNSTIYWSKVAQSIISVESDDNWHEKISKKINDQNARLNLINDEKSYINHIYEYNEDFDVIIIDGSFNRYECAKCAIKKLKQGGLIILDNSDWWIKTAEFLRSANLIEVDMTGFSPINGYTLTTSLFFHRDFNFKPKFKHQPEYGIGALHQYAKE